MHTSLPYNGDTGGTSIESARGISKAGGMPAKPPCKKQKHTPVLRAIQRDLTVIRMMSPVLVIQREKEVTVRNKEGYCKRQEHNIGAHMAENG